MAKRKRKPPKADVSFRAAMSEAGARELWQSAPKQVRVVAVAISAIIAITVLGAIISLF